MPKINALIIWNNLTYVEVTNGVILNCVACITVLHKRGVRSWEIRGLEESAGNSMVYNDVVREIQDSAQWDLTRINYLCPREH